MPTSQRLPLGLLTLLLVFGLTLAACDGGDSDPDPEPPPPDPVTISSANAGSDGDGVTLTFSRALDPASVVPGAFTVTPGPVAVASATASGGTVTLAFADELDDDEQTTYTVQASGLRDAGGATIPPVSTTFRYGGGGGGGGSGTTEIGAAYPNAGDNRIILISLDGDRIVFFNPVSGAATGGDDLDDLENGLLPLSDVGAAANVFDEEETYFFSTDGDTFTNYERGNGDFDAPASFEEEYDDSGYDLSSIGAAVEGDFFASNSIILFNQNGTEWQLWQLESDSFSDTFTFPSQLGNGQAPIPAVGAAFFRDDTNQVYLINRDGTQYTIWNGSTFTAAFDVEDLADYEF